MTVSWHKPPYILKKIKLEVTYKCPLACVHCSSEATPQSEKEMSRDHAIRLAKEITELGLVKVVFSGGEPLVWPWLAEVVAECAKSEATLSLYTSGNVDDFRTKVSELREAGISKAAFSIFGASPTTHERMTRARGSFVKTCQAVKEARSEGLATEFHFVPLSFNFSELSGIVSLAADLGATRVSVLRFVPQGRGALLAGYALNKAQNLYLKRIIETGRKEIEIRTGSPFNFLLINDSPACCAGIDRIFVGPEYDIYPCDAFKQLNAIDIVGTDQYSKLDRWSLSECWNRSPYLEAVREYLTTEFPGKCTHCSYKERCLSGCLAQKVLINGDFRKDLDPACLVKDTTQ